MKHLNLAVVGCGDMAGFTALVSRLIPQVRLSACCDVNSERARAFASRHAIARVFTDYAELLTQDRVDALYLAVPHHLHVEMILAAVHAKIPVFVEKPFTRTFSEGKKLVTLLAGEKVGVNYQYRYDSACYALIQAVRSGGLGKIHSMRINIPWHRKTSYFKLSPWHKTIQHAGGGTLITQGSHFLDIALWALDDPPISAVGFTASPGFDVEVDTLAHGIVKTAGGTLINIVSSMVTARESSVTIEVYGERGTATYRDLPFPSVKFTGVSLRKERPPEFGVHALQRSLSGFAKWVLDDKPFLIPAQSTLPVLAAVDAIYRSAQSGQLEEIAIYDENP